MNITHVVSEKNKQTNSEHKKKMPNELRLSSPKSRLNYIGLKQPKNFGRNTNLFFKKLKKKSEHYSPESEALLVLKKVINLGL